MRQHHSHRFLRLFSFVVLIVSLLHYYIGVRILWALPIGDIGHVLGGLALVVSAVAIPTAMLSRFLTKQQWLADALAWIGLTAMGLFSSLLVLTLMRDLIFAIGYRSIPEFDADVFLLYSAIMVVALSLLATLVGFINVRRIPAVIKVDIPIKRLPTALQGFLIAQISDIHIGATIKGRYLQSIVDEVNALSPHMVAITGDLVDGSVKQLGEQVAPLKSLRSQYGSYFVTGNHEYYSGALEWVDFVKTLGVKVLLNEHEAIHHNGEYLIVAGVTDYAAHYIVPAHKSDPVLALKGVAYPTAPKILLAHQPRSANAAQQAGFDLQLSGHTHGGQFWPWNFFVPLQQPYTIGLHRLKTMWIYINRGTGYWGPPKRLGGRSEITLIRLVCA